MHTTHTDCGAHLGIGPEGFEDFPKPLLSTKKIITILSLQVQSIQMGYVVDPTIHSIWMDTNPGACILGCAVNPIVQSIRMSPNLEGLCTLGGFRPHRRSNE